MTIKEVYIAFDGTQFDDQLTCEKYEKSKTVDRFKTEVRAYDENGKPLSLENMSKLTYSAYYLICDTNDAASFIADQLEKYNCTNYGIDGKGRYYYDECDVGWMTSDTALYHRDRYDRIVNILYERGK